MRKLSQFDKKSWVKLSPVKNALKQLRNDLILKIYLSKGEHIHRGIVSQDNRSEAIIISIAFNSPTVVFYLIEHFRKHIKHAKLIIADNSNKEDERLKIQKICQDNEITYFQLPPNKTRHPNRSHSLAMQWCYKRLIEPMSPSIFGFIDHDLIPVADIDIPNLIGDQDFYGARWKSDKTEAWQLWAGYCFFKYDKVKSYPLNFMYDFSAGLDTGGRNYEALYQHYNKADYNYALDQFLDGKIEGITYRFHRIDRDWLHLGGAGHRQDFSQNDLAGKMLAKLVETPLNDLERFNFKLTTRHI